MRRLFACLLMIVASAAVTPCLAQSVDFEGQQVSPIPAPRTAVGEERVKSMRATGIQAEVIYLERFNGTIEQQEPPKQQADRPFRGQITGGIGILLVLIAVGLLIALWFYFGGSALLAADTVEKTKKGAQSPDGWSQNLADLAENKSLAEIAAMADRRAALVRLLRLCLLQAASETQTGFKRSDTEREAFRRLPGSWPGSSYLRKLLFSAELAHYGGREVIESDFAALIEGARDILPHQRASNV